VVARFAFLLSERSRRPVPSAFRSSIARPTDTSVYASTDISRCRLQDSRPGWIRFFLSCRALSSPTTCRFIPALSEGPTLIDQPVTPIGPSSALCARGAQSSAYLQLWAQAKLSSVLFSVRKARAWDRESNRQAAVASREAEVYVFALLRHQHQETLDPLDIDQ